MTTGDTADVRTLTVRASAKINLHLGVGAARDDGFHPLTTVYQAVGLCDDLTAYADEGLSLELSGSDWIDVGSVPTDGTNLASRAAALLGRHHGRELTGRLVVEKAIPVAGGLAGGSADAAAALVALGAVILGVLALIPGVGFLEALGVPALAARLRRRGSETYAGLRTLARD